LPNARRAAEKCASKPLLWSILYEQRDWQGFMEKTESQAGMNGRADIEHLGYLAAYQRLAGKVDAFAKTAADIVKFADNPPPGFRGSQHWYSAEALLLNDRPADAIAVLTKSNDQSARLSLFELLAAQGKYREAFRHISKLKDEKLDPAMSVRQARVLYLLGDRDDAM